MGLEMEMFTKARIGDAVRWAWVYKKTRNGSFTVELKYFRSMPWYKAIFLSNFFQFYTRTFSYFMV